MTRATYLVPALVFVVASGSLFAQSRPVPTQFDNVRPLGRAVSEFKDDRIQIVVAYDYSQVHHDSPWLLIGFGALSRSSMRMKIERDRIEVVTPDDRLVPHATHARLRDASVLNGLNGLVLQLTSTAASRYRLDWYLPSTFLLGSRDYRFSSDRPGSFMFGTELEPMDIEGPQGTAFADLLFESPTGSWQKGAYAVVIRYDGEEAVLPIELM